MGTPRVVPIEKWSRDHWTTFAYAHDCMLNAKGRLDAARMRCNARLHRELVNIVPFSGGLQDGSAYPTRLRDGSEVAPHDDWSCIEDAVALGLMKIKQVGRPKRRNQLFGSIDVIVSFTPDGWAIWHQLDQWIVRNPKNWSATFVPDTAALTCVTESAA